jgi:hypothetical protein
MLHFLPFLSSFHIVVRLCSDDWKINAESWRFAGEKASRRRMRDGEPDAFPH